MDYESWEDLRPKTAVAANVGSGPDVVYGWLDDAFQFPDKLLDVTDIAEYLGEKYGGWYDVPMLYGRKANGRWIGMPFGGSGACMVYRKSWMNEAGFQEYPKDLDGMLKLAQAMKKNNHPMGMALGHAVGDANNFHWILWAFGGAVVDKDNKVILDSKETVQALDYAKELYQTFISGTTAWLDPSNNKAYLAGDIGMTPNGISIYYVALNSKDEAMHAIGEDTYHANLPMGPIGRPTDTSSIITNFIFKHTKYPEAARAYSTYMFEDAQYGPLADGLHRLLGTLAQGLCQAALLDGGSEGDALPGHRRADAVVRLPGRSGLRLLGHPRRLCRGRHVRERVLRASCPRRTRPPTRRGVPSATTGADRAQGSGRCPAGPARLIVHR